MLVDLGGYKLMQVLDLYINQPLHTIYISPSEANTLSTELQPRTGRNYLTAPFLQA